MSGTIRSALVFVVAIAVTACPLPFEFTPEETTGSIAASNDPSNPSVTAPPLVEIIEQTSGATVNAEGTEIQTTKDVLISFSSENTGAKLFYTLDGSDPIPGQRATQSYTGESLAIEGHEGSEQIRVIAIGPSMYPSIIVEKTVTVVYDVVATPVITPAAGTYDTDTSVTITTATDGATIWYRIADGTTPPPTPVPGESGSIEYTGPISIAGDGTQQSITAIAVMPEMRTSASASATYVISYAEMGTPGVSLPQSYVIGGIRFVDKNDPLVDLTAGGAGALRFRLKLGSEPSTGTEPQAGELETTGTQIQLDPVDEGSYVLYVRQQNLSGIWSDAVSLAFTIEPALPSASVIVVNSLLDEPVSANGRLTLREAIQAAVFNQAVGDAPAGSATTTDLIDLRQISGTISLAEPLPVFPQLGGSMMILGDDDLVIVDAGGAYRPFDIVSFQTVHTVELRGFAVENGLSQGAHGANGTTSQSGGGGAAGYGGAIYSRNTTLILRQMQFRNNAAIGGNGGNAGVFGAVLVAGGSGAGPLGGAGGSAGTPGESGFSGGYLSGGGGGGSAPGGTTAGRDGGPGGAGGFGGGGGAAGQSYGGNFHGVIAGGIGGAYGGAGASAHSSYVGGGGGGAGLGGAVYAESGTLALEATTFSDNRAIGGAGGGSGGDWRYNPGQPGQGRGGAVFVYSGVQDYSESGLSFSNNVIATGSGPPMAQDVFRMLTTAPGVVVQ